MARFFTSGMDLAKWLTDTSSSAEEATAKVIEMVQDRTHEQDIAESVRRIFAGNDREGASGVLHKILSKYEITEARVKEASARVAKVVEADKLYRAGKITVTARDSLVKEAQIMRQPGEYILPYKFCPKLPKQSAGQGLISSYNCRHYCLDSLVLDDDPTRVYCAEVLWRRHVMDKFSRDWKQPGSGTLVGGYVNERFYVFPDGGTPDNSDMPRHHGNPMSLAPEERTRQPRPHEWSTERRLQEQRDPNSTKSITVEAAARDNDDEDLVSTAYGMAIDLHMKRMPAGDAALSISKETGMPLEAVVRIQSAALRKVASHDSDMYRVAAPTVTIPEPDEQKIDDADAFEAGLTERAPANLQTKKVRIRKVEPGAEQPKATCSCGK